MASDAWLFGIRTSTGGLSNEIWYSLSTDDAKPLLIDARPFFFRSLDSAAVLFERSVREMVEINALRSDHHLAIVDLSLATHTIAFGAVDIGHQLVRTLFFLDDYLLVVDPNYHASVFAESILPMAHALNERDFVVPFLEGKAKPYPQSEFLDMLNSIEGGRPQVVGIFLESVGKVIRGSNFFDRDNIDEADQDK